MIHLDTNVAIALLGGRVPVVRQRFDAAATAGHAFALSVVVLHELRNGAAASRHPVDNARRVDALLTAGRIEVLPLAVEDAIEAADIRATLRQTGLPIGPYDVLIAAQARRAGATLVTANTREFARVPGLATVDWADDRAR